MGEKKSTVLIAERRRNKVDVCLVIKVNDSISSEDEVTCLYLYDLKHKESLLVIDEKEKRKDKSVQHCRLQIKH